MRITISLETDNAAFGDNRLEEVARLVRQVANEVAKGYTGAFLLDYNGNRVGSYIVKGS